MFLQQLSYRCLTRKRKIDLRCQFSCFYSFDTFLAARETQWRTIVCQGLLTSMEAFFQAEERARCRQDRLESAEILLRVNSSLKYRQKHLSALSCTISHCLKVRNFMTYLGFTIFRLIGPRSLNTSMSLTSLGSK